MKKKNKQPFFSKMNSFLLFLLLVSALFNFYFLCQNYRRSIVVSVHDGDSLQLAGGQRVGLLGVDAPEKGNCLADEAQTKLSQAALGRHVRLKHAIVDDYGRILADVIVEDFSARIKYMRWWLPNTLGLKNKPAFHENFLNRLLVRDGLARFEHVKNEYYQTLLVADQYAKANNLGIYSAQCRNTSAPESGL